LDLTNLDIRDQIGYHFGQILEKFTVNIKEIRVPDDKNPIKEHKGILGQVTSPLIFFALALLVIEGIIGITVVKSKLDAIQQFYMILVMAFLFLAVVGLVAWITVKYPLNLMDKVDENLKRNELMETLLGSDMFKDAVIDIVSDIVKEPQSKEKENGSK